MNTDFDFIQLAGLVHESIVDGPGIRTAIFVQGCEHHCKGCHNPITWDPNGGVKVPISSLVKEIKQHPSFSHAQGITLSGGDPMFQSDACIKLLHSITHKSDNDFYGDIWIYTGYTYEELISNGTPSQLELMALADVLVDGRFDLAKKSYNIEFRGSTNQRLIDIAHSFEYTDKSTGLPVFSSTPAIYKLQ